jgi:hypothetical protein
MSTPPAADPLARAIKVAYANVQGGNGSVLKWVEAMLQSHEGVDVVVISEHWFVNWDFLSSHPLFLAGSIKPPLNDKRNRSQGGVAFFCTPRMKNTLSHVDRGVDWIKVSWRSLSLGGVYLPPSMPEEVVATVLSAVSGCDGILGDFNVRWWEREGKKMPGGARGSNEPRHRAETVAGWAERLSLDMVRYSGACRLDQVWVQDRIWQQVRLESLDLPFATDHPIGMKVSFSMAEVPSQLPIDGSDGRSPKRYRVGRLDDAEKCRSLRDTYSALASVGDMELAQAELSSKSAKHRGEIKLSVDRLDLVLVEMVALVSELVLGTYTPSVVRQKEDRVPALLNSRTDALSAQRLWKKAQRGSNSLRPIVAGTVGVTAEEGVVSYWGGIWGKDEVRDEYEVSDDFLLDLSDDAPLASLTSNQVWKCIRGYPRDKSPGRDGIHARILFELCPVEVSPLVGHLTGLFRLCAAAGYFPKRWGHALVTLIPKSSDGDVTASSARPISLLPMFRRIFEALLLPSLTDPDQSWTRLHFGQAGFRKGFSCISNLVSIDWASRGNNKNVFVFLDFKAAYDSPKFSAVMKQLERRGVPAAWRVLIASFLESGACASVIVNGKETLVFDRNHGFPQGAVLSPIVFNLFEDALIEELNRLATMENPDALFFADDGALLARDEEHAESLLRVAESWARDNGMVFNVKKCGIVSLRPLVSQFLLQSEPLPVVDSYKYLGLPFTKGGVGWKTWLGAQVTKMEGLLNFMKVKGTNWHPQTRLTLYRTFVRPLLDYCGGPLYHWLEGRTRSEQVALLAGATSGWEDALLWICGISRDSNRAKVCASMTGLVPPLERLASLTVNLRLHLTEFAAADSPARYRISQFSLGTSSIISGIQNNRRYRDLLQFRRTSEDAPWRSSLQAYQLKTRLAYLSSQEGVGKLGLYISPSARSAGLSDRLLQVDDKESLHLALRWRSGTFGVRYQCRCGNGAFNRRHIGCYEGVLLAEAEKLPLVTQELVLAAWVKEKEERYLSSSLVFTLVDFMLNSRIFVGAALESLALVNKRLADAF